MQPRPGPSLPGDLGAQPAARKRSKLPLILGCLIGAPLTCGVCVIAGWVAMVGIDQDVQPGDRDMVVTIDDLTPYAEGGLTPDRDVETLRRTRIMGSATEVHYSYEPDLLDIWYVNSSVSYEATEQDARVVYASTSLGADVGAALGGELVDRPDLLSWGDESRAALFTDPDGRPLGNYFVARSGRRTVSVFFTGVYFDDPLAFQELLEPKLQRVELFQP